MGPESTVAYGTLWTKGNDLMPSKMLRHQLKGLSKSGRARFEKVHVYLNSEHHVAEKRWQRHLKNDLQDLSVEVEKLDEALLFDRRFGERFFQDPKAVNLRDMFPHSKYGFDILVLAISKFLNDCSSTYCVWMDPDVFVHKASNGQGWVDHAVAIMDTNKGVSLMTKPNVAPSMMNCVDVWSGLSQRYMVMHKERFLQVFPIHLTCAPKCDTWEAVVEQPVGSSSLATHCGATGFWVMHPPEKHTLNKILRSCAPDQDSVEKGLDIVLQHVEELTREEVTADVLTNDGEDFYDNDKWACKHQVLNFLVRGIRSMNFKSTSSFDGSKAYNRQ